MREMLTDYGFEGLSAPVVHGSALAALKDDQTEIGKIKYQAMSYWETLNIDNNNYNCVTYVHISYI